MSSEGEITSDGQSVIFHQPDLEGVQTEVQHSVKSGKPFEPRPGMVGFGVVILPTGQPRIVMQIKHADGTSLGASFIKDTLIALLECACDASCKADDIAVAAAQASRRPCPDCPEVPNGTRKRPVCCKREGDRLKVGDKVPHVVAPPSVRPAFTGAGSPSFKPARHAKRGAGK